MSDAKWKDVLWNLLDILPLRRITGRVALSAGLIGLAARACRCRRCWRPRRPCGSSRDGMC
jgi:hypothetical protein